MHLFPYPKNSRLLDPQDCIVPVLANFSCFLKSILAVLATMRADYFSKGADKDQLSDSRL